MFELENGENLHKEKYYCVFFSFSFLFHFGWVLCIMHTHTHTVHNEPRSIWNCVRQMKKVLTMQKCTEKWTKETKSRTSWREQQHKEEKKNTNEVGSFSFFFQFIIQCRRRHHCRHKKEMKNDFQLCFISHVFGKTLKIESNVIQ